MKSELKYLLHPLPVMLDPVWPRSLPEPEAWSLPSRPDSRTLLTFHGTAAIYQAIRCLGLSEGQKVLIPSYNCGHELEPVLRAGAAVGFYRVDEHLEIDLNDLETAVDTDTRAVLITHYFGFPQRIDAIRRLCDRHGLALIEDCAHALFSCDGSVPLGLVGDLAVYSLRKTLPLPHGGALVCHDSRCSLPDALQTPPRLSTLEKSLERYQKSLLLPRSRMPWPLTRAAFLATRLGVDLARMLCTLSRALGVLQWDPEDESIQFPGDVLEWGMEPNIERVLGCFRVPQIVDARRENYARLLSASDRFSTCRPLFSGLPSGVCPLYFPVLSDEPSTLVGRLRNGAVSAVEWWGAFHSAVPWERFPEAASLKLQVVALPIHQDLRESHLDRMIGLLTD